MEYSKLIGCNIYGFIRVSHYALRIIDTIEFQRLRHIRQLGVCYYVYPAANHTRFEHSLGVYFLAGKMLENIKNMYPNMKFKLLEICDSEIELDEIIIECVKIAALCHDIGHGPFSHLYDDVLLKNSTHENKFHESRSCLITEILCRRVLSDVLSERHITFIKSIIDPQPHHTGAIYQIVANKLNGIDVDKFDYLSRDSINLGLKVSFDANRIINEFIIDSRGNIAFPKQCALDIYELFHNRYLMHKKVYTHKTEIILNIMMADLFNIVDDIFGLRNAIHNINDFCKLTDDIIFNMIELYANKVEIQSPEIYEKIQTAYKLYLRIIERKLYHFIVKITNNENDGEKKLLEFVDYITTKLNDYKRDDFIIDTQVIGFTKNKQNELFDNIYFYNKKEINNVTFTLKKSDISIMINDNMYESTATLIYRNNNCHKRCDCSNKLSEEFKNWYKS